MHPVYALWSHPRSMSTAMERVMRERGDLDCAHEPFMYDYYVHRAVRTMPHFDVRPDHPVSYAEIRDTLLSRAKAGPVFFKDMSYYVMPHILEDAAFLERLTSVFLIRDPVASITSYFKLDPDVTREEIGLEAQWRYYQGLLRLGHSPVVIRAEDVRQDTRGVMRRLWDRIGLPWTDRAFDWQGARPEDWGQVSGWHGDVTASHGIRPLTGAEEQAHRDAFEAMARQHPRMRALLDHHLPFYRRLAAVANAQSGPASPA